MLYAEVLGLPVARVVDGHLEVGVGKHDREAQRMAGDCRSTALAGRRWVREARLTGGHEMHPLASSGGCGRSSSPSRPGGGDRVGARAGPAPLGDLQSPAARLVAAPA